MTTAVTSPCVGGVEPFDGPYQQPLCAGMAMSGGNITHRFPCVTALAALIAASACKDDGGTGPVPATLVKVSGDSQTGVTGQPLAELLVVRVTTTAGQPVAGVNVTWAVVQGGGSLSATSVLTDVLGQTAVTWTLGTLSDNIARATVPGLTGSPATFTANATATAFLDESTFVAATGATVAVAFPTPRGLTTMPYVEGLVTLRDENNLNNRVGDETPILPGNEFVVSGFADNVVFDFATPISAFGFWMVDGAGWDSQFDIEFLSGSSTVLTFAFDPAVNAASFRGFQLSEPVDKIVLREQAPSADENDPIGKIYTVFVP